MLCLCQSGVIRGLAKLTPTVLCLSVSSVFSPFKAHATSSETSFDGGAPFFALGILWGSLIVLGLVAVVTALILARRYRQFRQSQQTRRPLQTRPSIQPVVPSAPVNAAEMPARPPVTASRPKALEPLPPAQVHLPSAASPQPKRPALPVPTGKAVSAGKTNGKSLKLVNGRHSHRRKIFDYNRYFADLMSTVSGHAGQLEGASSLLLAQPAAAAPQAVANGTGQPANATFRANSELIASQTAFIEEQRRLIQEQTRVIEEKTKLISEKNQLLKMQTEMLENKLL